VELVNIPENWCQLLEKNEMVQGLPADLYTTPDLETKAIKEAVQGSILVEATDKEAKETYIQTKKWGPKLMEKRTSRRPLDGRSILEIA
jgi:hypothetical protein